MQASIKLLSISLLLLFTTNAFGQECDPKIDPTCAFVDGVSDFSGLPIDLLPPGARSLGLGGAFAGVADDATAAVANPAGLTILTAKEFSLHFRNTDSDIDFFDPDAYDSTIFAGQPGRLNKRYSDSTSSVSFASFVLPFDRFVFSAYYLTQLDFKSAQTGGPDSVYDSSFVDTYFNDNSIDASMDGFGASAAFRVTDSFSIGLTVQNSSLDVTSLDRWQLDDFFDLEKDFSEDFGGSREDWAAVVVDEFIAQSTIDDSDSDTTFSLGLMYNLNSNWSFGLVYREGAEFDLSSNQRQALNFGCTGSGMMTDICNENQATGSIETLGSGTATIKVPDTLTLGIGWRPTDTLLVSFDINDIGYSDLTPVRRFTQGFGTDVNSNGQLTEDIGDETAFHLGVEKVFVLESNNTFTVRGGVFTIEDHDGNATLDTGDTVISLGVGATFGSQGQFQMDLGASFGDQSDNIILSGIYRF
jgi:long-subunit fatty acid transport protein